MNTVYLGQFLCPLFRGQFKVLSATHGYDYWRKAITSDIQNRVNERIDKQVSNVPGVERSHFNDFRLRLDQCDVADYAKIIMLAQNWSQFATHYKSKADTERMFNDFRVFRNAVKHNQSVDTLLELRGQAAILWISRALNVDLSKFGIG